MVKRFVLKYYKDVMQLYLQEVDSVGVGKEAEASLRKSLTISKERQRGEKIMAQLMECPSNGCNFSSTNVDYIYSHARK